MTQMPLDPAIAAQTQVDAPATLGPDGEGWVLTLRRRLPQPVEAVWRPVDAEVLAADPPTLLEHRWGTHRLRWTLTPADGGGTDAELRHWIDDPAEAAGYAAGWRICLATLAATGDGAEHERVVGPRSDDYGWRGLRDAYGQDLGAR